MLTHQSSDEIEAYYENYDATFFMYSKKFPVHVLQICYL